LVLGRPCGGRAPAGLDCLARLRVCGGLGRCPLLCGCKLLVTGIICRKGRLREERHV
jgi:hypothetical protein